MRDLGFSVSFEASPLDSEVRMILQCPHRHPAGELLSEKIIGDGLTNFVSLLAKTHGNTIDTREILKTGPNNTIEAVLSPVYFDQPWKFASFLNILNKSIFLGQEEDPFIANVIVQSKQFGQIETLDAYNDLVSHIEQCRSAISALMTASESVESPLGSFWPDEPSDFFFRLNMQLSSMLPQSEQESLKQDMLDVDRLVGDSAFEPSVSPYVWLEEGLVPYPFAAEVTENRVAYIVEMPPSELAPALIMLEQILHRSYGASIVNWSFSIREGW